MLGLLSMQSPEFEAKRTLAQPQQTAAESALQSVIHIKV